MSPLLAEVLLGLGLALLLVLWRRSRGREAELHKRLDAAVAELAREREQAEERQQAEEHQQVDRLRKELEAKVENLQKLAETKTRFFENASHELRTPLTLVISPLEDLRDGLHGALTKSAHAQLVLAVRNARRLIHLVNQILALTRVEAGRVQLRLHRSDFLAQTRELAASFASAAQNRQIDLQMELPREPLFFFFDRDLVDKILVNLLSNALKFTPKGGTIRLTVEVEEPPPNDEESGGRVVLRVRDSGPGIPEHELPLIFERFYRVESQHQTTPGVGIGLSLVREIVALHQGHIEVKSLEGFGAEFIVSLPRKRDRGGASSQRATVSPTRLVTSASQLEYEQLDESRPETAPLAEVPDEEEAADRTTVLIVDDDVDLRSYVRGRLEPAFRTLEAGDGEEGLEIARRHLPDLIVCDVVMPRLGGHELCRALTEDRELSCVPIILLTGRAANEDRIEGIESGADAYLVKPFEVRELEAQIKNLIDSRKRLRDRVSAPRSIEASSIDVVSADDRFLLRVKDAIEAHMADEDFGVEALAAILAMSRGHLHRRLRELSGKTPAALIRALRLQTAAKLLAGKAGLVSEVAYGTGFKSLAHFSKCFKDEYGATPSDYMASAPESEMSESGQLP